MAETVKTDDLKPGMLNVPDDVEHEDGILTAWDGLELFWQSWSPTGDVDAVVCLQHGFGEHSTRYHHFATYLVRSGFAVIAIDARGHGRSGGPRGYISKFEEYPRDFDFVAARAAKQWPDAELFGFGHSNGGLIALHHALMAPGRLKAYAITSPFLGFQVKVPLIKRVAGDVMSKIYPRLAIPTELSPAVLSHDQAIVDQYANDPLNLTIATARWFTETKDAQADLLERAREIRVPVQMLVSELDELADPKVSEEVYHRLGSEEREFDLLKGLFHEALNEDGWEGLAARIVGWYRSHG